MEKVCNNVTCDNKPSLKSFRTNSLFIRDGTVVWVKWMKLQGCALKARSVVKTPSAVSGIVWCILCVFSHSPLDILNFARYK
jgi:hypothetical protein